MMFETPRVQALDMDVDVGPAEHHSSQQVNVTQHDNVVAQQVTAEATNRVGQYKCLLCSNLKYI